MTREQRNAISKQRIGESAVQEFAQHGYAGASINNICTNGNISKGILYHYFKDKDSLYLSCVQKCFNGLAEYLHRQLESREATLQVYFEARLSYFTEHPLEQRLFYDAAFTPPAHLSDPIHALRENLDRVNDFYLEKILSKEPLRPDITLQEAIDFFRVYQDFANTSLMKKAKSSGSIEEWNLTIQKAVEMFLYGIVARPNPM